MTRDGGGALFFESLNAWADYRVCPDVILLPPTQRFIAALVLYCRRKYSRPGRAKWRPGKYRLVLELKER